MPVGEGASNGAESRKLGVSQAHQQRIAIHSHAKFTIAGRRVTLTRALFEEKRIASNGDAPIARTILQAHFAGGGLGVPAHGSRHAARVEAHDQEAGVRGRGEVDL